MSNLNVLINGGDRSEEWAKQCVDAAVSETSSAWHQRKRDKLCYDLFNGDVGVNQFDHLTGEGDMKYPAAVRFIPVMRPLFEVLRSTESTRPLEPKVFTVDTLSLEKKQKAMASKTAERVVDRLQSQQMKIDMMRAQLQQQAQAAQQSGEGDNLQQMRMQQMLFQVQQMDGAAGRYQELVQREMKETQQYYKYRHRTREEIAMKRAMDYWVTKYNIKDLFMQGFDDLFTVDNEIYYIPDVPQGMDPKLRRCHTMDVYYPSEMGITYLDECSWVCVVEQMTVTQLVQEFPDLKSDEIERLGLTNDYMTGNGYQTGMALAVNEYISGPTNSADSSGGIYSGSSPAGGIVSVYRACWRVWRKLTVEELEEAGVLSEYVTDMSEQELKQAKIKKGEVPEHWMVSDVWEGVRIGADTYRKLHKRPMQFRDRTHVGFSYLPYIGYAYNGVDKKPYSMVWAVRDIQLLYNLVYYQQELLIALAGVKGFIMDHDQLPDGMSMAEWLYYLKQGVGWIQSRKDGARPSQFNQFTTFDMSISDGVAKLNEVLNRLEYMMGRVLGVPPQRMGEITQGASGMGANRDAVANSTLTTEMLFYRHRRLTERVMNRIMQVAEHTWKEGKRGAYVAGDLGQEMFSLTAEDLASCSFELFYNDGQRDERIRTTMEQAVMQQYGTGAVTMSQLSSVLSASSINEVTDMLAQFEKQAQESLASQSQSQAESQKEVEAMKANLQLQLKKMMSDAEKINSDIASRAQQLDFTIAQTEMKAKGVEAASKAQGDKYKVDTEADVEREYLQYERERDSVDAKLRMLELKMKEGETKDSLPNKTKNRVND